MKPTQLIHRLQSYGKRLCWHPVVTLDKDAQQHLHELLTDAAHELETHSRTNSQEKDNIPR